MKLSERAEEAATFFGKTLDDNSEKPLFRQNFFANWQKVILIPAVIIKFVAM